MMFSDEPALKTLSVFKRAAFFGKVTFKFIFNKTVLSLITDRDFFTFYLQHKNFYLYLFKNIIKRFLKIYYLKW